MHHRSSSSTSIACSDNRSTSAAGFTLVELLLVIAIIALLVAIALPALAKARFAARETLCLSNHRQIMVAWAAYTNDYSTFPFSDDADFKTHELWAWGGVDWYPGSGTPPTSMPRARPVNPYLGPSDHIDFRLDVFRCPLDTGTHEYASGLNDLRLMPQSPSGDQNSAYGIMGTSYWANQWMYCTPTVTNGGWGPFPALPQYRSNLGPRNVIIAPSRFVVLIDRGPATWMLSSPADFQFNPGVSGEWWHAFNRSAMSFLDGSARVEKKGLKVCAKYSIHLVSPPNPNGGWRWPAWP